MDDDVYVQLHQYTSTASLTPRSSSISIALQYEDVFMTENDLNSTADIWTIEHII